MYLFTYFCTEYGGMIFQICTATLNLSFSSMDYRLCENVYVHVFLVVLLMLGPKDDANPAYRTVI